jgi:hypothetical protein
MTVREAQQYASDYKKLVRAIQKEGFSMSTALQTARAIINAHIRKG